ncbi:kinase-like domain-containing protein [Trametes punicea]|nr:kinase-like domain-containing protein [Trametes punicea]
MNSRSREPAKPTKDTTVDASDFEYIRTLHAGERGESLSARKLDTGKVYTVRLIRKTGYNGRELAMRIQREQKMLRVLTECAVPFVAKLFWSFEDQRAMYLVTNLTEGRNLKNVIQKQGPVLPHEAVLCGAELAEGISGLHAHGIVHTSLRPENVLIGEDGHLLISGFDDAVFLYDDAERPLLIRGRQSAGNQEYQAPELILGWEYDYAVDWWSFGLVLFWMMTLTHPFVDDRDAGLPSVIRSKVLHADLADDRLGMDENAYQLISRCLQRNPALRIDGLGVKMHDFFSTMLVASSMKCLSTRAFADVNPTRNWDDVACQQVEGNTTRYIGPSLLTWY